MSALPEPQRFNAMPRSQEWGFSMLIRWVNADLVTHILPRAPYAG